MATRKRTTATTDDTNDVMTDDTSPTEVPSSLQAMRDPLEATLNMPEDWLELIKAHHVMIEAAFDAVIDMADGPIDIRQQRFRRLCALLTAHCVAEENVIYPALAMAGLQDGSDKLYIDQAHAKVMNAALDIADDKGSPDWLEKAQALRQVVLEHAKADEEGDLYPRLQAEIDATTALKLGAAYRREFVSVKPG